MPPAPYPMVLIAGPTATGKTALAVRLARRMGGEIVSADSMQVYRGFVIGTAQPTEEELQGVPCHLVGCVSPDARWTVADWLGAARARIEAIRARGRLPVVAGGTGLYFKALTDGLFDDPAASGDAEVRGRLEAQWRADGGEGLRRRLERDDPEAAARIHRRDAVRTVRALEVLELTGRTISEAQRQQRRAHRAPRALRFVLCAGRKGLYARIDDRVRQMMRQGFLEEVRGLIAQGACESWPAMRALGYAQMLGLAQGRMSEAQAVADTQRLSRRYAKQQIVLYRQWGAALWLDAESGTDTALRLIEKSLEICPTGWF